MVRPMYDRNRELVDRVVLRLAEIDPRRAGDQGLWPRAGGDRPLRRRQPRRCRTSSSGIFWRVSLFTPVDRLLTQINLVILLAYGG